MHSAVVIAIATAVVPISTNGSVVVEVEPCDSGHIKKHDVRDCRSGSAPCTRSTDSRRVGQYRRSHREACTPHLSRTGNSGLHGGARTVYRGSGSGTVISGGVEIPPALFKQTKRFAQAGISQ